VKHSGSTDSVAGDSRITPLGATLRHWKLDELPGLWDVLIGNMSFVGLRPDVSGYADKLQGNPKADVFRRSRLTKCRIRNWQCGIMTTSSIPIK